MPSKGLELIERAAPVVVLAWLQVPVRAVNESPPTNERSIFTIG